MTESIFVIIPGFGGPNVATKLEILRNNISVIESYSWNKITIRICVYDDTVMPLWVLENANIEIIREPGIVAEFMIRHAHPDAIGQPTIFMGVLDDILLDSQLPWENVLKWQKDLQLDILSPCLTLDSKHVYKYMLHNPQQPMFTLRMTRVCEFFCYIMPFESYKRYYPHLDVNNPWMWGLDLILEKKLNMRTGIMNTVLMKHFYHNECYVQRPDRNPGDGYVYTLRKYGEPNDEELRNQQHTKYVIYET